MRGPESPPPAAVLVAATVATPLTERGDHHPRCSGGLERPAIPGSIRLVLPGEALARKVGPGGGPGGGPDGGTGCGRVAHRVGREIGAAAGMRTMDRRSLTSHDG